MEIRPAQKTTDHQRGSRQVGKTESIKHFAAENYESIIEINFVRDEKYKGIISDGYEAADIIKIFP